MCSAMSCRWSRRRNAERKGSRPKLRTSPSDTRNEMGGYERKQYAALQGCLNKGVVERNRGSSVGLKFDVVEFKDLLGGVSPSQWVWLTPPEASGLASSSSAAAPTAAASTATARAVVQAHKPKFKPSPPPLPRGPPGLSREPLQVRLFTFGLQPICKCGQVWLLASVGPVACVGCVGQLVAEYGFAVKEQSSNKRALAFVHRATGDKCECVHVKNSLLLCVFPYSHLRFGRPYGLRHAR